MLWEVILKLCLLGEKCLAQDEGGEGCPAVLQKEGVLNVNIGAPVTLNSAAPEKPAQM